MPGCHGPFPSFEQPGPPGARGSLLKHEKLIEFIQRNYEADPAGQWFFQNGPQRVYVELEATPWIWRLQHRPGEVCVVASHTGRAARVRSCLLLSLLDSLESGLQFAGIPNQRKVLLPFARVSLGPCLMPKDVERRAEVVDGVGGN